MSDKTYSIKVALEAQLAASKNIISALQQIDQKIIDIENNSSGMNKVVSGAAMNMGAKLSDLALKMPHLATESIKAFGQQEAVLQKLSTVIRENGGRLSEVMPIMREFAANIQQITAYGDNEVTSMMAMASSMGVSSDKLQDVIKSAIGLSNALNMDVITATKAAANAVQGKTGALQEYIPSLSKCKNESEKLAQVQKLAQVGFSQAQAEVETLNGRLKQAANAWTSLQQVCGDAFAPTIKVVASALQGTCNILANNATLTKILTVALSSLAVGFAFAKVGGLLNVAKMFIGVSTSVKGTTVAVRGLTGAIAANPLGLIATAASAAIMALSSLADYCSSLSDAEEEEANKQEEAIIARRKAIAETKTANAIINDYEESLRREGETSEDIAGKISVLADEIAKLESGKGQWADGEQIKNAELLVEKKKQLVDLQDKYLAKVNETAKSELEFAANRENERKYRVEMELNAARKSGVAHIIAFKENELRYVEELQKSVDIQKKYYADHKHLVNSEEDRIHIMKEAQEYAQMQLDSQKDAESTEKWLNSTIENGRIRQRNLDMEILRAKAAGDDKLAEQIDKEKKIAQLAAEIFDSTRKEGMSRQQLEALSNSATVQAKERYDLEKSITDEAQKQNIAKNAQAKIEDIILTHKIEQLKAEGKTGAAKALEEERDIKRTLGGLDGVSSEDKKKLANVMRQTNAYKDRQNNRATPQAGGYAAPASTAGGGYYDSAPASTGGRGPTPPKPPRAPATVSAKNMPLYEEWKAAGGTHTGQTFADFRQSRAAKSTTGNDSPNKFRLSASRFIDNVGERAGAMAGVKTERKTPQKSESSSKKDDNVADGKLSSALSDLKKNPSPEGEKQVAVEKILTDIQKTLNETKTTITQLKSSVSAIATSKK